MTLTRRYRFSSSHRLHSDRLAEAENWDLFGKCNNPYGHGHNYVLDISVRGGIDGHSGRVLDPGRLDRYIQECVLNIYDHRDLNRDAPEFLQLVPTTENLALAVRKRLEAGWNDALPGVALAGIRIEETPRNAFEA